MYNYLGLHDGNNMHVRTLNINSHILSTHNMYAKTHIGKKPRKHKNLLMRAFYPKLNLTFY